MKGCMKLFQFSLLGQLFPIVPPTICMGDSYRRDNSDSEQGQRTCVPLPKCRFHIRLPLILWRSCRFQRACLFVFTPFAKIAAGTCKWAVSFFGGYSLFWYAM